MLISVETIRNRNRRRQADEHVPQNRGRSVLSSTEERVEEDRIHRMCLY